MQSRPELVLTFSADSRVLITPSQTCFAALSPLAPSLHQHGKRGRSDVRSLPQPDWDWSYVDMDADEDGDRDVDNAKDPVDVDMETNVAGAEVNVKEDKGDSPSAAITDADFSAINDDEKGAGPSNNCVLEKVDEVEKVNHASDEKFDGNEVEGSVALSDDDAMEPAVDTDEDVLNTTSSSSSSSTSSIPGPGLDSSTSPSSSSSSVSSVATVSDEDERNAEAEEEMTSVMGRPQPKCRYKLLSDLRNRELFRDRKPYSSRSSFVSNRMGSLSLVSRFELSSKLDYHRGCVNALHFNASGSLLASGSDDLDVVIWDWQKKQKLYVINTSHKSNVFQCKFLALNTDTHVVTSARDGYVRLAELSQGSERGRDSRKLAHHGGPAHKLSLLATQPHSFLSGGEDAVVFLVDVRQPKAARLLRQIDDQNERKVPIYSIDACRSNDNFFCTAGKDKFVRIYDRRFADQDKPKPIKSLCPKHMTSGPRYNVTSAVFNHNGEEVIASYNDDDIYLFKTHQAEEGTEADFHKRFQGHRNSATVKGVNFYGPKSEFVVSGSDCGHVFFWAKDTEAIVHVVHGDDSGVVNVLEPHPNLPALATSGLDPEVKLWMPTSNKSTETSRIEKIVKKNCEMRRRGEMNDPEGVDGQMLWMLWRHIRRIEQRRRRRHREGDEEPTSDNPDSSNNGDDDEDDDDDEDSDSSQRHALQCPTS